MNILNNLKLDKWWSILLWCGVALFSAGLIFDIQLVERRYLIGLGSGLFIVGITYFKALKTVHIRERDGYFEGQSPILSTLAKAFVIVGWVIVAYFGARIFWVLAQ